MTAREPLSRSRFIGAGASALLWLSACAMPALTFRDTSTGEIASWSGAACAFWGAFAVLSGAVAWLANRPGTAAIALLSMGRNRGAVVMSLLAVVLALTTWGLVGHDYPMDEGGVRRAALVHIEPGGVAWVASMALPGLIAAVLRRGRPQ